MIIENITIQNFGLFKEKTTIDLSPTSIDRNIIVVSGKNGVGKSTLHEAIHLCLLGSLSVDSRISETNYETYLSQRCYTNNTIQLIEQKTLLDLTFNFVKSGTPISYNIIRTWNNVPGNVNEQVTVVENGKELTDISKKEKNIFIRELIQPGFAKIMFFDGEQLSSLFESGNLSNFIQDSCNDLFGLNFIELLKTDLNHYTTKLLNQHGNSKNIEELKKNEGEIQKIDEDLNQFYTDKEIFDNQLILLKQSVVIQEEQINKQGRWMSKKLDKINIDKQKIELAIQQLKKEVIELYGSLGPFVFCKNLCGEVKNRLLIEREIEKWFHAREMLVSKSKKIETLLKSTDIQKKLFVSKQVISKLVDVLTKELLSKPDTFIGEETIHHNVSDVERTKIIIWIDSIISTVSADLKFKTNEILINEEKLKQINKEQATFSKGDIVQPLVKQLHELSKQVGATEQKILSVDRKIEEQVKRKSFYENILSSVKDKMVQNLDINDKLHLSHKTKLALEDYSKELLTKKVLLLEEQIVKKFNLLCRKKDYIDSVIVDPKTFEINLKISGVNTEHKRLSAGEKQLFILSLLWSLRELTNIKLPLVIDTPIARLDKEHRNAFFMDFLPAMYPQVILLGTDTEIMYELLQPVEEYIAHNYSFVYDPENKSNKIFSQEDFLTRQTA